MRLANNHSSFLDEFQAAFVVMTFMAWKKEKSLFDPSEGSYAEHFGSSKPEMRC